MSRKRIFEIIEKSDGKDRISSVYDISMIIVIVVSLLPLAFKTDTPFLQITDKITVAIFMGQSFFLCDSSAADPAA